MKYDELCIELLEQADDIEELAGYNRTTMLLEKAVEVIRELQNTLVIVEVKDNE